MVEGGGPQFALGFFRERRAIGALYEDHDASDAPSGLTETVNIAPKIASALRTKLTTLHELQTVYSLKDMYDLLEIAAVEAYNRRVWEKYEAEKAKRDADSR